jgi:hypothetical protein
MLNRIFTLCLGILVLGLALLVIKVPLLLILRLGAGILFLSLLSAGIIIILASLIPDKK